MPKSRARAQQPVSSRVSSTGRWNVTCMGSIWQHCSLDSATAHRIRVSITSGAMEDMSGKVQNESTHILGRQNHKARAQHSVSSRASSMGRWRTCLGRFKMQTLTYCGAKITSTRTAVSQFKGKFNGAMERYTWVRFAGKLTSCHASIWRRSAHQRGDG